MRALLTIFLLASSSISFAGTQEGTVSRIIVRGSDNLHYFYLSGVPSNRPVCANGHNYWMIQDENSAAGKSQLAMLLTAYSSGLNILVTGTDSCDRWGDGEDVETIQFQP